MRIGRAQLDELYARYNRREYVHPDPLEFLYAYPSLEDREIVGLIASSLAYGRVAHILRSVAEVLARVGPPRAFVDGAGTRAIRAACAGFRHRWTSGDDVADLLLGVRGVVSRHGSLGACVAGGMRGASATPDTAVMRFATALAIRRPRGTRPLVPRPIRGSACKRLHLYLRWMVRRDDVDPGGWDAIRPSQLVVPVDTHMHRIARALGLTQRRQADGRTAAEITAAFATVAPDDPVRYDFALTRLGIRADADLGEALRSLGDCDAA